MTAMRTAPKVGDTVIADGVNYRINSIGGEPRRQVYVRAPDARHEVVVSSLDRLRWDALRGVWRVAKA